MASGSRAAFNATARVLEATAEQVFDPGDTAGAGIHIRLERFSHCKPLMERFNFELFIPFANLIMVFVDRPFGHNFDEKANWDRGFIDRVHARDEAGILSGKLKPTQMIAAMTCEQVETKLVHPRLTPEYCMRLPERLSSSR